MKEEERKRLYEMIGAMKAARAFGGYINAAQYAMYKQLKDSAFYKITGKDWKTFCKEDLGRDHKTIDGEIKSLEEFGEPFLSAIERIGLNKRQLNLLCAMPEDAKADIKAGEIKIGDNTFIVDEIPEKRDEFLRSFSLLGKELELAKKEAKQATKKLEGIDGETKKSEKALLKKIADLEAIMKPETPEKLIEALEAIDNILNEYDNAVRILVWKTDWVKGDPATQSKVEALQTRAEKRFESFRQDWDAFCNGNE